jgi:chromosome segregation ATPase
MMSEGGNEDYAMVDRSLLQSLVARVDSLEKRSATAAAASQSSSAPAASSMEITALKQQVEVLRQAVVATKNGIATSTKESKDSKTILENLRFEVDELKIIVADVQNLALDNNQKLAAISLQLPGDGEEELELLLEDTEGTTVLPEENTTDNNMSVVVEDVDDVVVE